VIFGEVDPEQVAKGLAGVIDDKTILVASSDLSHYHPYATAKALDQRCLNAVCDLNLDQMKNQEACGKGPILALMHLAKLKGWKPELLDARNSGDVTGENERVVGYSAVALLAPRTENYGARERKFMLDLARKTLTSVATNGGELPAVNGGDVAPNLLEKRACFVTLTKSGVLRGCIGHLLPQEPLYQAVAVNAHSAALRDPRFPPVQSDEVGQIRIEISVLTEPQPLQFSSPDDLLAKLQPHEDGVVLRMGFHSATFLPQVWAQIPDKEQFLSRLAEKAGCEPSAWRAKDTTVSIYRVESFEEKDRVAERN
jgi:AmmeMemoRadiSam system protein A